MIYVVLMCAIYLVAVTALAGPVAWKWRRRATWHWAEPAALLLPFWLWVVLSVSDALPKSMSNMVVEPLCLGVAVSAISWLRVLAAPTLGARRAAGLGILAALMSAWLLWQFMPLLNE